MRYFSTRAMKSAEPYRDRADLQKCGFDEIKFSAVQLRFVKLQRPPPEMSIFLPIRFARSRTTTRRPRFPTSAAQKRPAAPPPKMIASYLWFTINEEANRRASLQQCSHFAQSV